MPEHQDTTLSPATTYFYRVTALNSAGESAPSTVLSVATPSGLPAVPTGFTATAVSTTTITLAWNASTGATSYKLQRSASPTGTFTTITTSAETSFMNTGLTPAITYYYRVLATNSAGDSVPSSVSSATTLQDAPPPPPPPGPGPGGTCPSGSIKVNPGDNIKSIIQGASSGQTICIAPGTYQGTFITPPNGVSIIARDPAVRTKVKSLAIRNSNGSIYKVIDAWRVRPTVHIHGYGLNVTSPGSLSQDQRGQVFTLSGRSGIVFEGIEMSRAYGTSKDTSPERQNGRLIHEGRFTARNCWFHRANQDASGHCDTGTLFEFCDFGPATNGTRVTADSLGSSIYLGCCGGAVKSSNGYTAHDCWNHDNDENGFWKDVPGATAGKTTIYNCFIEDIGYSGVRDENNQSEFEMYDCISINSGYLALSAGKSHTGGVAINSSTKALVHHCRFGGNFENSGIDLSGSRYPMGVTLRDNDLSGDAITGTHSCGGPITCSNNFNI